MPGPLCRRGTISLSRSGLSLSVFAGVVSPQVRLVCGVLSTKDFLNTRDSVSLATLYKSVAHLLLPGELSVRACNLSVWREPVNIGRAGGNHRRP